MMDIKCSHKKKISSQETLLKLIYSVLLSTMAPLFALLFTHFFSLYVQIVTICLKIYVSEDIIHSIISS